jgi:non-canonical (house-cleaning) NTP pyrophosphatase
MSEAHGNKDKEVNIIVNGRPKKVPDQPISFEEVVALAFNPAPPNAFFTVTWSHGNDGGSLTAGHTVPVRNGMKFDVTETGQS